MGNDRREEGPTETGPEAMAGPGSWTARIGAAAGGGCQQTSDLAGFLFKDQDRSGGCGLRAPDPHVSRAG